MSWTTFIYDLVISSSLTILIFSFYFLADEVFLGKSTGRRSRIENTKSISKGTQTSPCSLGVSLPIRIQRIVPRITYSVEIEEYSILPHSPQETENPWESVTL